MDTETTPTRAQRLWVYALEGLYNSPDLAPSERRRAEQIVASNEIQISEKEDFAIVASYLLAEKGRWRTLQTIYRNYDQQRNAGGELDEWYFLTMAEFAEIQRLLQTEEFDTAIVRGCSFTEHFLDDNVDWFRYTPIEFGTDEEPSFAQLINFSREEGFLTDRGQKLLHFTRQVRNHTAHHAWLAKNIDLELVLLAGRTHLFVLDRLLEEKAARDEVELPEFEAEPQRADSYIAQIEDEFGWKYLDHRKYWAVPDF